jgi:ABC-type transporter MlaC component
MMKKILMMIAALAMTTMFAQANEAAPVQEAVQAVQEATDAIPAPEGDKNATEEAAPAPEEK